MDSQCTGWNGHQSPCAAWCPALLLVLELRLHPGNPNCNGSSISMHALLHRSTAEQQTEVEERGAGRQNLCNYLQEPFCLCTEWRNQNTVKVSASWANIPTREGFLETPLFQAVPFLAVALAAPGQNVWRLLQGRTAASSVFL